MFDPSHWRCLPQLPVPLPASYLFGPHVHAGSAVVGRGFPRGGVSAVMPGAGITAGDIAALTAATGARECLAPVRRVLPSRRHLAPTGPLGMGGGEAGSRIDPLRGFAAALWRRVQAA